ncbi:MAG TPA: ABC transporter ATP-binding protein [Gaiellaceae bacterium]|nr:ABC transporter ATP-binding protein [Gaiellaceae bacterium]
MLETFVDRKRLVLARDLRVTGLGALAPALLVSVLAGALPVGFVVATSVMIGALPAAIRDGSGSHGAHRAYVALALAAASFALRQALVPIQTLTIVRLARRFDGWARGRFMDAAFAPRSIAPLEDPTAREAATMSGQALQGWWFSPGDAAAANISVAARYAGAIAMAIPIGILFAWWAAVWLLASGLVLRSIFRHGFGRVVAREEQGFRHLRLAWYFRQLGLGSAAAKEIRIFALVPWLAARYRAAMDDFMALQWSARWRSFIAPWLAGSIVAAGVLAVVFVSVARGAAHGDVSLGTLALVLQSGFAVLTVASWYPEADIQTAYGGQNYGQLLVLEEAIAAAGDTSGSLDPGSRPERELRFENVSFSYPGSERPVLAGLDLTIPARRSLAIVGLNGAGKTTLVKLLAGLYEPTGGRITCDGTDLREFDRAAWQRRVAAIFQDFRRYELPLRENVAFGALQLVHDDDAIRRALERSGGSDLLASLPGGLETPLSTAYAGGTDLSGGQWQRVAIARALIAVDGGASVLVLDEPTANLDVRAEAQFFERFLETTRDVTSILISHRFSTVRRADRIVVLEHGRVVEDGTHEELVRLGGRYAEMFELQAARFAAGAEVEE